mgnify:CR=1 FL=1
MFFLFFYFFILLFDLLLLLFNQRSESLDFFLKFIQSIKSIIFFLIQLPSFVFLESRFQP